MSGAEGRGGGDARRPRAARRPEQWRRLPARLVPGVALASAVAAAAWLVERWEARALAHVLVDGLVLAILLGMLVRTLWAPGARWRPGVNAAARQLLEVAVVLLGASVSLPLLLAAGPALLASVVLVVLVGLGASLALGRLAGLEPKLAILVACGNAICGNSAIAAVAPVIRAEREQVASSVAFTALLGVALVLALPLLVPVLDLSFYQYGVVAGMTVYAVPQVLAATFPVSELSGEVGTLVKLVRVLLLGPVVLFFAVRHRRPAVVGDGPVALRRFVPWFIVGFVLLAAARSTGLLAPAAAAPLREVSRVLTLVAMAGLGLGVDVRAVGRAGVRVSVVVTASLLVLLATSVALVRLLRIG